jgi:hypothetical protein
MWWHIIILEERNKKKDVGFIRISKKYPLLTIRSSK